MRPRSRGKHVSILVVFSSVGAVVVAGDTCNPFSSIAINLLDRNVESETWCRTTGLL